MEKQSEQKASQEFEIDYEQLIGRKIEEPLDEYTLKTCRDWYSVLKTQYEKGRAAARAEIYAENFEKGFAEGKMREKFRIVNNLLNMGVPLTDISEVLGLSEEEIRELTKQ